VSLYAQRVDERQYMLLSDVETDEDGRPAAFSDVLAAIISGQSGQLEVTENARRAHYHDGVFVWTPVISSHYYYAPVTGECALCLFLISELRSVCT